MKFDAKCALSEDFLIWYFDNGLRSLIKLWINKKSQELDDWEELIKKTTKTKAKAKMQLAYSRDIDQHCYHENWPIYASLNKATKNSKIK